MSVCLLSRSSVHVWATLKAEAAAIFARNHELCARRLNTENARVLLPVVDTSAFAELTIVDYYIPSL